MVPPMKKPQVGTSGLGATIVSGTLLFLKKMLSESMFPIWKISKGGRAGWERRSFPEFCGVSKNVIRIKCCPERRSACGNERGGSDFRFWHFAVSQKMCSELNFAPKEKPKVGTSGSVAALVSWVLRFLKTIVARRKFCPWGKSNIWNERAGSDFRF